MRYVVTANRYAVFKPTLPMGRFTAPAPACSGPCLPSGTEILGLLEDVHDAGLFVEIGALAPLDIGESRFFTQDREIVDIPKRDALEVRFQDLSSALFYEPSAALANYLIGKQLAWIDMKFADLLLLDLSSFGVPMSKELDYRIGAELISIDTLVAKIIDDHETAGKQDSVELVEEPVGSELLGIVV